MHGLLAWNSDIVCVLTEERLVVEEEPRVKRMTRQLVYMRFCFWTTLLLFY